MFDPEQKTTTAEADLSVELMQFYNEFAEFNEYHAFFCDAFAGVVSVDELLDTSTTQGIHRCSRWMKHRMEEFKTRLEALLRKSCVENH